jgi:hypothetical protein
METNLSSNTIQATNITTNTDKHGCMYKYDKSELLETTFAYKEQEIITAIFQHYRLL